jgi:predicted HicB family RNase H-like nuclease
MMARGKEPVETKPRWMTSCDVARYNLKMPEALKKRLKKEAQATGMSLGDYICLVLEGDIKRKAR